MIADVWLLAFGETLHPNGKPNIRVTCPFHSPDRHPSCDVSLAKDAFCCRSCGASGGYLDVVVRAGLADTRHEAAKWLERRGLRVA